MRSLLEIKGTYNIEKCFVGDEKIPVLVFYREQETPMRVVICIHGLMGNKEGMLGTYLRLADAGFCSVAIDARMHGERSDPELWAKLTENFPRTFFTAVVETAKDVSKVIDFLESKHFVDPKRVGLMGVSMGGSIILVAVMMEKRIKAAASVLGPAIFPLLEEKLASLKVSPFEAFKYHSDEETRKLYEQYNPLNNLDKFPPTALLLIVGMTDHLVPKECIIPFHEALKSYYNSNLHNLKLVMYDVGHMYTSEMETEVIRWFNEKL